MFYPSFFLSFLSLLSEIFSWFLSEERRVRYLVETEKGLLHLATTQDEKGGERKIRRREEGEKHKCLL